MSFQGGRAAILELTQQPEMRDFLSACGLSPESLERMAFAAAFQERWASDIASRAFHILRLLCSGRWRSSVASFGVHMTKMIQYQMFP